MDTGNFQWKRKNVLGRSLNFCRVKIIFVEKDGKERRVEGPVGTDLLHLAHENDIDLEGRINANKFNCPYLLFRGV